MTRPTWPADGDTNYGTQFRAGLDQLADGIDQANATLADHSLILTQIQAQLTALGSGSVPQPSTVLNVVLGDGAITVKWTLITGAASYLVGRNGTDAYGAGPKEVTVDARDSTAGSYTFSNLVPGSSYQLYVQPQPGGKRVTTTATVTPRTPTVTDTTVTATAGDGHILVAWTAVTGATGYLVERDGPDAVGGGSGWSVTDPASATSRDFLSLVNGTAYTVSVTPLPGGVKKSKTVTPTAPAPPAGTTTITVGAITTSSIAVTWTAVTGNTLFTIGRIGVDQDGNASSQTTNAPTTLSHTFANLKAGQPYQLYVQPSNGPRVTVTASTTPATTTPPTGGAGWLSGCGNIDYPRKDEFGTWRGEAISTYRFWLSGDGVNNAGYYLALETAGWPQVLDYAIGAPPEAGISWASAATGGADAFWTKQCSEIHANWGSLKGIYLAMGHELNGNWFSWSTPRAQYASAVTPGLADNFKKAWQKFYNIVQRELVAKGRNAKCVINYAAGQPYVEDLYPGNQYVDIIAFDTYDHFIPNVGHIRTQSDWDNFVNLTIGGNANQPYGPGAWAAYAASKGKPFGVGEWGLSDTTGWANGSDPAYDNPFYIEKMNAFFRSKAPADKYNPGPGKIAFENLFSAMDTRSYHLALWPDTSINPNASAKYKSLVWGT